MLLKNLSKLFLFIPLILYFGKRSLISYDEGFYALQAKWILENNNWIAPLWWGNISLDRTIGIQNLIAISQKVFGNNIKKTVKNHPKNPITDARPINNPKNEKGLPITVRNIIFIPAIANVGASKPDKNKNTKLLTVTFVFNTLSNLFARNEINFLNIIRIINIGII